MNAKSAYASPVKVKQMRKSISEKTVKMRCGSLSSEQNMTRNNKLPSIYKCEVLAQKMTQHTQHKSAKN